MIFNEKKIEWDDIFFFFYRVVFWVKCNDDKFAILDQIYLIYQMAD
jgi:hypothetical protein